MDACIDVINNVLFYIIGGDDTISMLPLGIEYEMDYDNQAIRFDESAIK